MLLSKTRNGVEIIMYSFKRSIRVVTYRLGAAFGSLHMQQLHGFDKLRNDQGIIRNRSAKIDTTVVSLYLPESNLFYLFFPLAKIIERMENGKNRVLWPFGWRSR
jgi:hypothetical protein